MIDVEYIRAKHGSHGCLITENPIHHQNCLLNFHGFLIAIDCDKCKPFLAPTKRPDLLVLRKRQGNHEWFIIEIKRQLRTRALNQVEEGLKTIANNKDLFGNPDSYIPMGLLAYTYSRRAANIERYRGRPFQPAGRPVALMIRKCGEEAI